MPLILEDERVPPRWAARKRRVPGAFESVGAGANCVRIAVVNNMPDAALEDTEMQFLDLIEAAAAETPVRVSLHSLPGVPRGKWGQQHLNEYYSGTSDLFDHRCDGVIVTGAEPKQADLREEPYWSALSEVLEWAETNTLSAILSCLAAHAGVLHSDGIVRHPLGEKQCGIFSFAPAANSTLIGGGEKSIRVPHSRWNEVKADELAACGYSVLTQSAEGGVDAFLKKKKCSLFMHFQGHPEYDAHTLLKEYRRDVKRFARGEREAYPSLPNGYLGAAATKLAMEFRYLLLSDRRELLLEGFPEASIAPTLQKTWQSSAIATYRNWLSYIVANKAGVSKFSAMKLIANAARSEQPALQ